MVPPIRILPGLLCLPILCLPIQAKAQTAGSRGVNPLTGTPLSLEDMHWTLEQARLEEQLQASLLNRRKFELERQRLDLGGSEPAVEGRGGSPGSGRASVGEPGLEGPGGALRPPRVQGTAGSVPQAAVAGTTAAPPGAHSRLRRAPAAGTSVVPWSVVGVRAKGSDWCLLVAEAGQLWPVCAGEWRRGHHVEAVSAQTYTVDGVSHPLEIPVAQLQPATTPSGRARETSEAGEALAPPSSALPEDPLAGAEGTPIGLPASASALHLASPQPLLQR